MAVPTPQVAAVQNPQVPLTGAGIVQTPFVPPMSGSNSIIGCSIPGCNEPDPSAGTIPLSTGGGNVASGSGTSLFKTNAQLQSANPNPNDPAKLPKVGP